MTSNPSCWFLLGAPPNADLEDLYKALKAAGSTPAPKILRQGLNGDVPTTEPLATQPDAVRVKLLEARTHYENLETEPLKHVLREVRGLLGTLPNPFLYRDLLGAYFLLRAESALVEEDVRAAKKDASVSSGHGRRCLHQRRFLYAHVAHHLFGAARRRPNGSGDFADSFSGGFVGERAGLHRPPAARRVPGNPFRNATQCWTAYILSLSAAHMLPQVRFIDVSPEQVSEISWWPQRPNAASLRAAWQEKSTTTRKKLPKRPWGDFMLTSRAVDLLFVGEAVDVFWHSGQTSRLEDKENTQAWAAQIHKIATTANGPG